MAAPIAIWDGNRLFGIEWNEWKIVGWLGNGIFFSRFFVQWVATERRKRVVIPISFWWLSVMGSTLLLIYGIFYLHDSVVIFAYAFTWIPYIRNIVIHHRSEAALRHCAICSVDAASDALFCHQCGAKLPVESISVK